MTGWAHRAYLEVEAHPIAVPYARRCTRQVLTAWQLGHIADATELIVSELTTNAVQAAEAMQATAPVAVYLALDDDVLFVLVRDCSPQKPAPRLHADDDENGRGLEIVQALAGRWGAVAAGGGKVVWARLDLGGRLP